MKTLNRLSLVFALMAGVAFGQLTTTNTTLSAGISAGSSAQWCIASATGVVLPSLAGSTLGSYLFADKEAAQIVSQGATATCYNVKRGQLGTTASASHASGTLTWVSAAAVGNGDTSRPFTNGALALVVPTGSCASSAQYTLPVVVASVYGYEGSVWTCSGNRWVTVNSTPNVNVGTAIAAATTIAPLSRMTHITGTTAIATITVPAGFLGGSCIQLVPDGIFTTTTGGNIALASTAVVSKALEMCWDAGTSKWYPSY